LQGGATVQKIESRIATEAPVKVEELLTAEKPKAKRQRKSTVKAEGEAPDKPIFPAKSTVNAYGFIHLSNGVREAFGAKDGVKTPITIDLQGDALIIKKA
jgi:hypothetical protein